MSWQLALEYIKVLIWPLIVLTLGLTFKRQVGGLIARLQSLDTPVGSANFGEKVEAVGQAAAEIGDRISEQLAGVEPDQNDEAEQPEGVDNPSPADHRPRQGGIDASSWHQIRLGQRASTDPTSIVLNSWRSVEQAMNKSLRNEAGSHVPMHHLIRRVADKGLLSSQLITLANDLFELRNQVVHGTGVTISITEAESYSQAAANVIDALTLAESSNYLAISYEEDVLRALRGMIGDRIEVIKDNSGPDFKVTLKNGKSVVIETKFLRRHRFSVARASETLEHVRNSIGNDSAVLIVTNTELAPNIEEFNERHSTESPRAEVIQWANQMDDNDLFRALARSAR